MDLPQVKAAVKSWEKAFKARHKREPTKQDIKDDSGGIAEQYALYRKLSKVGSSSQPASTASSSQPEAGYQRGTPRSIPNSEYPTTPTPPSRRSTYPSQTYRNGGPHNAEAGPNRGPAGEQRTLTRTASRSELQSPSSPLVESRTASTSTAIDTFLTPRKARPRSPPAYTGPIHDPNPLNPFLASPSKARTTPFRTSTAPPSTAQALGNSNGGPSRAADPDSSSPFIHASSPRKLREVLEANSLRKVRARLEDTPKKDTTPRTRARKRLRGEMVDDTPGKVRVERKKRGGGKVEHVDKGDQRGSAEVGRQGRLARMREEAEEDEDSDDDGGEDEDEEMDGLGPSPMKPPNGVRSFTSLLQEAARDDPPAGSINAEKRKTQSRAELKPERPDGPGLRSRQTQLNGFFGRGLSAKSAPSRPPNVTGPPDSTPVTANEPASASSSSPVAPGAVAVSPAVTYERSGPASPVVDEPDELSYPIERLPTPPTDPEVEATLSASQVAMTPTAQRRRILHVDMSTEEVDGGAEARVMDRELIIVPTRRAVRPRRHSSDLDVGSNLPDDSEDAPEDVDEEYGETVATGEHELGGAAPSNGTEDPAPSQVSATAPLPPHLMSLLSLRSPTQRTSSTKHRTDLVVRALFDSDAARQLRALQKGQDVRIGGEEAGTEGEDDEAVLQQYNATVGFGASGGRHTGEIDGEHEDGRDAPEDGNAAFGDDDWDEEDEGWKRTGADMDDW